MGRKKKCVVGYKSGSLHGRLYGYVFSSLMPCCPLFRNWFLETGNNKSTRFISDDDDDEKNGFNFVQRGEELCVELRLSCGENDSTPTVGQITHCPFCGAELKMKHVKSVALKETHKLEFAGYKEV